MPFSTEHSDQATLQELGSRIARYRLNLNLTQEALAKEAGISKRTLHRVEHGYSTHVTNLIRILRVLKLSQNLGALIPEPAISPIQQVKAQGKIRQRASTRSEQTDQSQPWSWGDDE